MHVEFPEEIKRLHRKENIFFILVFVVVMIWALILFFAKMLEKEVWSVFLYWFSWIVLIGGEIYVFYVLDRTGKKLRKEIENFSANLGKKLGQYFANVPDVEKGMEDLRKLREKLAMDALFTVGLYRIKYFMDLFAEIDRIYLNLCERSVGKTKNKYQFVKDLTRDLVHVRELLPKNLPRIIKGYLVFISVLAILAIFSPVFLSKSLAIVFIIFVIVSIAMIYSHITRLRARVEQHNLLPRLTKEKILLEGLVPLPRDEITQQIEILRVIGKSLDIREFLVIAKELEEKMQKGTKNRSMRSFSDRTSLNSHL